MAGIGIKLQKIYEKKTILAYLTGFGYSAVVTVAPMFVVIGTIMLMSQLLGYENVGYARRGLFSGTLLYIPGWKACRCLAGLNDRESHSYGQYWFVY